MSHELPVIVEVVDEPARFEALLGQVEPVFREGVITLERAHVQIRDATGAATEVMSSLGSMVAVDALRAGEIDVYVDYTGTIWARSCGVRRRPRIAPLCSPRWAGS